MECRLLQEWRIGTVFRSKHMGQFVDLKSADGFVLPAWVAEPDTTPRGAVVVLQEIFGVNSHIRAVADRFAARGYLAVAPPRSTASSPVWSWATPPTTCRLAWS